MSQPVTDDNYFEIFRLPVSFHVNLDDLRTRYHLVQMQVHPDNHTDKDEQSQILALSVASKVNDAYQTLLNPELRATYMLGLISGDENLVSNTAVDSAFLMEQMALREDLEEIVAASDNQHNCSKLASFLATLDEMLQQRLKKIEASFDECLNGQSAEVVEWDTAAKDFDFSYIASTLQEYRYILKLAQETRKMKRQACK